MKVYSKRRNKWFIPIRVALVTHNVKRNGSMVSCNQRMACVLFWMFVGKWYAEFMINIFCRKAWSLMSTMVSCRGSLKPKEPCPIGISDIVLLHNHVVQALAMPKTPDIWELCPASMKTQFLRYFKLFAKRLETMDPQYRILPVEEPIGTTVSVPGFVFEFNRRKVMADWSETSSCGSELCSS